MTSRKQDKRQSHRTRRTHTCEPDIDGSDSQLTLLRKHFQHVASSTAAFKQSILLQRSNAYICIPQHQSYSRLAADPTSRGNDIGQRMSMKPLPFSPTT